MTLTLKHQNKVQFLKRLRDRYRTASGKETCRLAWRMLKHLADGDVTEAQMLNAWNMTAPEWAVKAAALQTKADKWAAILAAESVTTVEQGD